MYLYFKYGSWARCSYLKAANLNMGMISKSTSPLIAGFQLSSLGKLYGSWMQMLSSRWQNPQCYRSPGDKNSFAFFFFGKDFYHDIYENEYHLAFNYSRQTQLTDTLLKREIERSYWISWAPFLHIFYFLARWLVVWFKREVLNSKNTEE